MTSVIVTPAKQVKRPAVVAALSTVCALTVAIGVMAWQGGQPGGEPAPVVRAAGQEARLVAAAHPGNQPDVDSAADGPLGNTMSAAVGQAAAASTLYLVGTADAARALQAIIDGDARVRAEQGESALPAAVAVVGSVEDE